MGFLEASIHCSLKTAGRGYYTCTTITLPASADLPEPSADDEADTEQDVLPESIENPQYQSFYASVFFDGENWSIAE